jgi:hypothetical protein
MTAPAFVDIDSQCIPEDRQFEGEQLRALLRLFFQYHNRIEIKEITWHK